MHYYYWEICICYKIYYLTIQRKYFAVSIFYNSTYARRPNITVFKCKIPYLYVITILPYREQFCMLIFYEICGMRGVIINNNST